MGELARKLVASRQKPKAEEHHDKHDEPKLAPDEENALKKIKSEAAAVGSYLTSDGKGGLPPSLVLGVMRRDGFRCKVCGEYGDEELNQGIGVHHKNQHITEPKARHKGVLANREDRRNDPSQLTTICAKCHDAVHQKDRAEYGGKDADELGGK